MQYDIPGGRPGPLFVNADQVRQVLAERAGDKVPGSAKLPPSELQGEQSQQTERLIETLKETIAAIQLLSERLMAKAEDHESAAV